MESLTKTSKNEKYNTKKYRGCHYNDDPLKRTPIRLSRPFPNLTLTFGCEKIYERRGAKISPSCWQAEGDGIREENAIKKTVTSHQLMQCQSLKWHFRHQISAPSPGKVSQNTVRSRKKISQIVVFTFLQKKRPPTGCLVRTPSSRISIFFDIAS